MKKIVLTTTFALLRSACACTPRYRVLREALGLSYGTDEPINILTILKTNGIEDALWALTATAEDCEKVARFLAADFAEMALPEWLKYYPNDDRPRLAIQAARDFANGTITALQRSAAWSAAASAAMSAAESAAASAARSAAWSAAASAAASAAMSAAWSAAESAVWSAAESAVWSAAMSAQAEILVKYLTTEVTK
jgi:hypothetical protein